jgi:hypothetical protein
MKRYLILAVVLIGLAATAFWVFSQRQEQVLNMSPEAAEELVEMGREAILSAETISSG